ncbi:hypothetical protein EDD16DRAFT_1720036 [Pisolithus croceorrhizus]|nr:hypothetical protein EDD16DRAFT_1720036 [Pisolithus croceorrhizus]KAI6137920.1 hypothetical protein EDD17DRAFT_1771151 [Pisolithus thermaeus]
MVGDIIYVEVSGSLSKWNMHTFSVDIQSPSVKKVVLHLKDTVDTVSLPPERKYTLEEEALEQVEEASSKLRATHVALWKVYEGTIGIQEMFTRNSSNSLETEHVNVEDVDIKPDPAHKDTAELCFECTSTSPCHILPHHCGNPNLDQASSMKPWAYYIIPFDPIEIPMQLAKRKAPIDTSTGPIQKHAKLEIS